MNTYVLRSIYLYLLVFVSSVCFGSNFTDDGSTHLWNADSTRFCDS